MQSIFGTDGIRGKYNKDLTYSLAYKIGYSLGKLTLKEGPILIGRDTRKSGSILMEALTRGLNSTKKEVVDLGICPTPAIPFLIRKFNFSSGVMISASHNPPEYNGIKIFDSNGKKLHRAKELEIEKYFNSIFDIDINKGIDGNYATKSDLLGIYINSLINSLEQENLKGLKIILDTCHGSATSCAEKVFKTLGAQVKVINSEPDGFKINLNCGSTCLTPLRKAILENNSDMGFSFDGDADRVIGMDSSGNILDGDHILFLWGRELMIEKKLNKNLLITTDMANLGFENSWNNIGGILKRTNVGDKFIYEEILKQKGNLGGEQSGHILSGINNYSGDGILTAIQISKYCSNKNINLKSWLETSFSPYPQKLTNISIKSSKDKIINLIENEINSIISQTIESINETCRIFVRPSGTEPVLRILVEANNNKLVKQISKIMKDQIENIIKINNI
ncbi:MAG: phosphoglucosamine mutase [Prochlorococcus sp. SP3034]|nr:phosphoglucosamine mutase [Prochlorococcus sp. SP3034]|tara:strand:+ start:3480 stop:4832 length:1353 start_codon:yes stop_codon:yes gene_type:complete